MPGLLCIESPECRLDRLEYQYAQTLPLFLGFRQGLHFYVAHPLSIRDYVKLAAPEPEVLKILGEDSERNGTNILTARQIDQVIKATRAQKK